MSIGRPRKNLKGTTVTVTQRDITRSLKLGVDPVALATRRATKREAYVYATNVELTYGSELVAYALPKRAIRLVTKFNDGSWSRLKPLTFTLGRKAA